MSKRTNRRTVQPQSVSFTWDGKAAAYAEADINEMHIATVIEDLCIGKAPYKHQFIEADNLQALKNLQLTHQDKVDFICIDPPYNTGSSFVYEDNFKVASNAHAAWLSMMLPRLVLAKKLLASHGSIAIHIDRNESHYLKILLDEIF